MPKLRAKRRSVTGRSKTKQQLLHELTQLADQHQYMIEMWSNQLGGMNPESAAYNRLANQIVHTQRELLQIENRIALIRRTGYIT